MVECRHSVRCAVVDADGIVIEQFGDSEAIVFPRSSIKPIQALPFIETGAADACFAATHEIALSCASHNGEETHAHNVEAWLTRLQMNEQDLECGSHRPTLISAADALVRANRAPCPLHNNCSGKHAGFLATAKHLGEDPTGYIGRDHAVQKRVRAAIESMCDVDLTDAPEGIDGCGIPVIGMPLSAFAFGLARMAAPAALAEGRAAAASRIVSAMIAAPEMVAGTERFDTDVMAAGDTVACKTGAEGVFAAILPAQGIGIALKVDDGATRASEAAMAAMLLRHANPEARQRTVLEGYVDKAVTNAAGRVAGAVRAVLPA